MYPVYQIPVLLLHILEADIAQNTRIIYQHVNAPEVVDGRLDDGFAVLDRVVVRDGLATCRSDLIDYYVCGLYACC